MNDLQTLFEYIEPADENRHCYSLRTLELLLRSCIEVEANCKAILKENSYTPALRGDDLNMSHYCKVETSHRLSSYEIRLPVWRGTQVSRRPFEKWAEGERLPWYQSYNEVKHNRHESFSQATLDKVAEAVSAVAVLLSAQFWTEDFSGLDHFVGPSTRDDFSIAIGGYFRVRFPDDWPKQERYDFHWGTLKEEGDDPFQDFVYR